MDKAYQKQIKILFSLTIMALAATPQKTAEGATNLCDSGIDDFIMSFCMASVYALFHQLRFIFCI